MLSQLGCVRCRLRPLERVHLGHDSRKRRRRWWRALPSLTEKLLGNIPRLEGVRAMLAGFGVRFASQSICTETAGDPVLRGSMLLRVAADFDSLELRGNRHGAGGAHDAHDAGRVRRRGARRAGLVRGVSRRISEVQGGAAPGGDRGHGARRRRADRQGSLLAGRGYVVTAGFVERVKNYPGCNTDR